MHAQCAVATDATSVMSRNHLVSQDLIQGCWFRQDDWSGVAAAPPELATTPRIQVHQVLEITQNHVRLAEYRAFVSH